LPQLALEPAKGKSKNRPQTCSNLLLQLKIKITPKSPFNISSDHPEDDYKNKTTLHNILQSYLL